MSDDVKPIDRDDIPPTAEIKVEGSACREADTAEARVIQRRVHEKIDDYSSYEFTTAQSYALNIFFDLVQEFDGEAEFYSIVVSVPKIVFNLDCKLYLLTAENTLKLIQCSEKVTGEELRIDKVVGGDVCRPTLEEDRYMLPIRGNHALIKQLPFKPTDDVIGCFEIYPADHLTPREKLFWEKYANRIGFQLHNRLIQGKNKEHLSFIRNLVKDIGHNVIVPNMYFKLYFNKLRSRIRELESLKNDFQALSPNDTGAAESLDALCDKFHTLFASMDNQFQQIYSHYEQTSLFLETLLRQRHFEEGRYVLEKRDCNLLKRVIEPQLERFKPRFEEKHIRIDLSMGGIPDMDIRLKADIGLISQVYANLFSNAVKYTREVNLDNGVSDKFIAFGWDNLDDYFGPGVSGIKFNVFTTGKPLEKYEVENLFQSGFRGANADDEPGTGHGLSFVKEIVELHDGEVGYEAKRMGNNFFFILPVENTPPVA